MYRVTQKAESSPERVVGPDVWNENCNKRALLQFTIASRGAAKLLKRPARDSFYQTQWRQFDYLDSC